MKERTIESYFCREVKKAGGEVRKLVTPGRRNAPDRLVLWPRDEYCYACAHFVELKAPGEKPRSGQVREHKRLRAMGFEVWVIDTHEKVNSYIRRNE